jgi:hypothetical protein
MSYLNIALAVKLPTPRKDHQSETDPVKLDQIRQGLTEVHTPAPKPFLDAEDDLVIPFDSDSRYHWWNGGQPISETLRELYEERAAIREFEGGQSREEAEIGARVDIQRILDKEKLET